MGCEDSRIGSENTFREPKVRFKPFIDRKQQSNLLLSIDSNPRDSLNQLIKEDYAIGDDDLQMIELVLMSHPLFYKTRNFAQREIIDRLEKLVAEPNQIIFSKNDDSDYFYIVVEGLVCISDFGDNLGSKFIERGHYFGDLGLVNKAKRSATAKAIMKTKLLALKKDDFLRVSLELSRKIQKQAYKQIKNIKAFSYLKLYQKHRMSFFALELKFPKGTVIFREGENSDCFFVVKSGKVKITVPDKETLQILPRQSFGESCLRKQKTVRSADAICSQNSIIYAFSRYDIDRYMGRSLMQLQYSNKIQWALRHQNALKLSQSVLQGMVQLKEIRYFRDGQLVVKKGAPINNLIISLQGGIGQYKQLQIINLNLLNDLKHHIDDMNKVGSGNVAMISIDLIEGKFNRRIKHLFNKENSLGQINESEQLLMEYTKELVLERLKIIDKKQYDGFGHILKVRDQSNIQFTLRVVEKNASSVAKSKMLKMLKAVSSNINHFLISKTYKVFQDQLNIYFLSKCATGDSLSSYLQTQSKLSVNTVRHFAACIITIIEYLHCKKILWKDMKIQSLFIDCEGYINLADLLHLQQLQEEEFYMQTKSKDNFWYLPPETIAGQAYGYQSDFWSLGVILYRMLVGYYPFGQHLSVDDPQLLNELWQDIQEHGLNIPNWLTSDVKMLLKTLLNRNYMERSLLTIGRIKSMSFFKDYDWLGLLDKKVKNIPYYPRNLNKQIIQEISIQSWKRQQRKFNQIIVAEDPFSTFDE